MKRKSRKGKHVMSKDIFLAKAHDAFTVSSSKISVLLFIYQKYGAWEHSFSMFYAEDFF